MESCAEEGRVGYGNDRQREREREKENKDLKRVRFRAIFSNVSKFSL